MSCKQGKGGEIMHDNKNKKGGEARRKKGEKQEGRREEPLSEPGRFPETGMDENI